LPSSRRLKDIIDNAQAIFRYTEGMDVTAFRENRMVYDAVERICEASAKLGDMAVYLMPDQPWHKIRALGNIIRHEYDVIEPDRLFDIVATALPGLCAPAKLRCAKSRKTARSDAA